MSFCRQTSRVYSDLDDLNGALNALGHALEDADPDDDQLRAFLKGAYYTVYILLRHSWVDTQADYMAILGKYFRDEYDRDMIERN